jgi:hypothetical protein
MAILIIILIVSILIIIIIIIMSLLALGTQNVRLSQHLGHLFRH